VVKPIGMEMGEIGVINLLSIKKHSVKECLSRLIDRRTVWVLQPDIISFTPTKQRDSKTVKTDWSTNMTELQRLAGVGPTTAKILREAGYETAEEVLEDDDQALLSIDGIGRGLVMKMEITEERNLKGIRVLREWRSTLRDAVEGTEYTLSDAVRVLLPDDVEENRMEIPEENYVPLYVEEDVHRDVTDLAGKNVTSLDVLDRYVGDVGSEAIRGKLDKEQSADEDNENNDD
jgi:hypothetical protein